MKEKIAIVYICTGKYEMFWDDFYYTCKKNFYPQNEKHFFVFTDSNRIIEKHEENVTIIYQKKAGWPFDTLLRYNWFCMVQDKLLKYDYCYYFNANTKLIKKTNESIIPFPSFERPLLLNIHSHMYDDVTGELFQPERNSCSKAYIPDGSYCRAYSGGFFGGKSEAFVKMCTVLRDWINEDLENGIIAIWHDQSHLQKYAVNNPHCIVPRDIISSEEYAVLEKCHIMFMSKEKNGGNDKLREVTIKVRILHLPKKIYGKLYPIFKIFKLDGIIRKLRNIIKK